MEWTLPPARPVRERLKYGLAPREHLEFLRRHDPIDRWEQAWRTTFELLRALNERVLALNARLLVLVVPSMHQVEHGPHAVRYGAEALAFAGRPLGRIVDWNLPERRLTTFLGRADIPVRVLVTELREAARSGPVYTQDQHLNERGHEVAAEVVLRWLEGEEPDRSSPIAGAPVNVLGEFRETSRLDFRREAHYAALGDGWLSWHPEGEEGGAGWIIGPSALVVLPARTGDLVVRGVVPKAALLPVEGKVVMVGGPRKNFALSEHGPFELRVPWRAGAGGVDSTGHAAVMIIPGTTHVEKGFPVGFRVLEVAFE
jgi:hypothetical protein